MDKTLKPEADHFTCHEYKSVFPVFTVFCIKLSSTVFEICSHPRTLYPESLAFIRNRLPAHICNRYQPAVYPAFEIRITNVCPPFIVIIGCFCDRLIEKCCPKYLYSTHSYNDCFIWGILKSYIQNNLWPVTSTKTLTKEWGHIFLSDLSRELVDTMKWQTQFQKKKINLSSSSFYLIYCV